MFEEKKTRYLIKKIKINKVLKQKKVLKKNIFHIASKKQSPLTFFKINQKKIKLANIKK